jgi:hypothetical protein
MDLKTFKKCADKCKHANVPIGAMFCWCEPLLDDTILDKYRYARDLGIMPLHVGLNTNVSLLTEDKWDEILRTCYNITLSFYDIGDEYKRLTNGQDFQKQFDLAVGFIKRRDRINPAFQILIGCNILPYEKHGIDRVKEAFKGYNVGFIVDSAFEWRAPILIGSLGRLRYLKWWRCDGWTGALQLKWNCEVTFCAYDMTGIGHPEGYWETSLGNFLDMSWSDIHEKFVRKWREGSTLCKRCDLWHHGLEVVANDCKYPDPLPGDWYDWQDKYTNGKHYDC